MLNVSTLWLSLLVNFIALCLVWAYVMRSYPSFAAARYWAASALAGVLSSALGLIRGMEPAWIPLMLGGSLAILACCLAEQGIRRFFDLKRSWWLVVSLPILCGAGLLFFLIVYDNMPARIIIYSVAQAIPIALGARVLLWPRNEMVMPGAKLAGYVAIAMIGVYIARCIGVLTQTGGDVTIVQFNGFQAILILLLGFLAMAWNFGFLLMAIDRLREEVADLALVDDLTGVANRRHFLQRLQEECFKAQRSCRPFALLAIDLDGFKEVNDTFGHAAGDHCLRHFTLMVQSRLRPGDMLARVGGDEFCVILPGTHLQEAAPIARRILDACRADALGCSGDEIPLSASIGVAQWTERFGAQPERLIVAADGALYSAKKDGRNCYALAAIPPTVTASGGAIAPEARSFGKA